MSEALCLRGGRPFRRDAKLRRHRRKGDQNQADRGPKLLGISKRGTNHLRKMLVHGARAALGMACKTGTAPGQ